MSDDAFDFSFDCAGREVLFTGELLLAMASLAIEKDYIFDIACLIIN